MLLLAGLLWNVLTEFGNMWRSLHSKSLLHKLRTIYVDDPVNEAYLEQFHTWWQTVETPKRMSTSVREFAVDGHEKIATKCYHDEMDTSSSSTMAGSWQPIQGQVSVWVSAK